MQIIEGASLYSGTQDWHEDVIMHSGLELRLRKHIDVGNDVF